MGQRVGELRELGAEILAVAVTATFAQQAFAAALDIDFPLLSDWDRVVCESYGARVLGIRRDDRCLSAAKAFFAYGLGNSLLFPLSVGACAILEPAPSRPDALCERAHCLEAT